MLNQILDYVDNVMSSTKAPNEVKVRLENELIRSLIKASESTSMEEMKGSLCSPEKLAEELSKKFTNENFNCKAPSPRHDYDRHPRQKYRGEYMREQSNVNLKLLYIPLIQISSGTERISMPLMDDDDD